MCAEPGDQEQFVFSQFAPIAGSSPMNSSMSLAMGDSTKLFGHRVGILGGF